VSAVTSDDSQDCPFGAVTGISGTAQLTFSTSGINLSDNSATYGRAFSRLFDNAYELMTNRSVKPGIPARDLEVGIANTGKQHTHQGFIVTRWFLDLSNHHSFPFYS
jgi:hypothetical protein